MIEPSNSLWREQVWYQERNGTRKGLLKFANFEAYPLAHQRETVITITEYRVYNVMDRKSVYHQVFLQNSDKKLTAFEANGRLYQFCRIPFCFTDEI